MKLVKGSKDKEKINLTLRLDEETLNKIDRTAKEGGVSRQKLIEAILKQVLADKNFELRIDD